MEYGLIGGRLGHSYSKVIHEMLCGYRYDLCPLPTEEEVRAFMTRRQFRAINVTIPYKLVVMEYCSYIDPHARAINAVNTIVNRNGLLYGYNTDYPGFSYLCDAHGVEFKDRTVLILGTGGTHNTTWAVAHDRGAKQIYTVSRHPDPEKGELTYAQALTTGAQIIINTTPVGMYPNVGVSALDITSMPGLEAVIDVIYNPDKTELILRAEELGVPVAVGGLEMLVAQAVYAAEFFLDRKFEDAGAEIARVTSELRREQLNIALIGMPSSGKTTLGKLLAKQLGRTFVDLDDAIVKADGRSIPDIFAAEGEDGFRAKETEQTARFGKENRQLLSCGGGVVKRPENLRALHQNGVVLFIDRPVEALAVGGSRPLSSSMEALRTMEAQRRPLYRAAADAVVHTRYGDVLPSNKALAGAGIELIGMDRREFLLKDALDQLAAEYDFIFIDCPPSLELLTLNALCAADSILVPVQGEYFALEGLSDLMNTVRIVRRSLNPKLALEGVLLTMFDGRTNLAMQVAEEVKHYFPGKVYATVIPRNVRLSEAPSHGKPITAYDRTSRGAEAYQALAVEFLKKQ